uniref:G-protein coupled receptors family 1 profile domain-containing protein n=1 Tax=Denticeps clupeoides TaxID=299321 RepID=A0AAY4CV96_9TELE
MGVLADNITFDSSISPAADIAVAVTYSIFGVCSLCGNSILLYVSYQKKQLLKPAELFIVNLACSDLGMTFTLYPLAVSSSFYHRWLFGRVVCVFYAFCGVLFGICSLATLTVLSTICCLKVCYPLYGNRFSHAHGQLLVACVWAYALLFAALPLLHLGAFGPEPYGTACCIDWARSGREAAARCYTLLLLFCCYVVPSGLIAASYALILLTVRDSRRALRQHWPSHTHTHTGDAQSVIVKLSVAVCIGFLVAWSPYAAVSMWAAFGRMDEIPPLAFAVPAVFAKTSPLYNPLVSLLLKPNFRQDLAVLGRRCAAALCQAWRCHCDGCQCLNPQQQSLQTLWSPVDRCVFSHQTAAAPGACELGHDPFESFRLYPRGHQLGMNTVQLTVSHVHTRTPPFVHAGQVQRPVQVLVHGKAGSEGEGLEITLETVATQKTTPT